MRSRCPTKIVLPANCSFNENLGYSYTWVKNLPLRVEALARSCGSSADRTSMAYNIVYDSPHRRALRFVQAAQTDHPRRPQSLPSGPQSDIVTPDTIRFFA